MGHPANNLPAARRRAGGLQPAVDPNVQQVRRLQPRFDHFLRHKMQMALIIPSIKWIIIVRT